MFRFRGWSVLEKKFITEFWIMTPDGHAIWPINHFNRGEIIPNLSTNQFDKNNVEIYQSDIIIVPEGWSGDYLEKSHLDTVIYYDNYGDLGFSVDKPDDCQWCNLEVITNIHESPKFTDYVDALIDLKVCKGFKQAFEDYKKGIDYE